MEEKGWVPSYSDIEVQFADIDSNLHVNNCTPVRWIQEARVRFIAKEVGQYMQEVGLKMIVRANNCVYDKEIFYGDYITVYVQVGDIGTTSWNLETKIWSKTQQAVVVTSTTRIVQFDPQSHQKVALSGAIKAKLQSLQSKKITSKL